LFICGMRLFVALKAQRGVTLSSSEAEYFAILHAVKEIKVIFFILCDIGMEVEVPIVVKTDSVVALVMTQNSELILAIILFKRLGKM
jgi:hypothetical protein